MRAQHAFAAAGRAGGEQNVADVVGRDRGSAAADRVEACRFRASGDEVAPCPVFRFDRHSHDVPQCRQGVAVQAGDPVGAQELTHSEQHRRPGAGQDVTGFRRGVAGVHWHYGSAGVVNRQAGHYPVPGVRRPDGHPVAGLDAERDERGGCAMYFVAQRGGGEGAVFGDQRVLVGE